LKKKENRKKKKKGDESQALVAHACNPNYSGGRDQEDRSSKPAKTNTSGDPILKKIFHKKGLVEWLKVKAEFKLKYCKEKQNKKKNSLRHTGTQTGALRPTETLRGCLTWPPGGAREPHSAPHCR
jgi:hypothetical protein